MSVFFSKHQYACHKSLNEARAFQYLIKKDIGETQIWIWIDEMIQHHSVGLIGPFLQKLLKSSLDHDIAPALMLASAKNEFPVIVRIPYNWRRFLSECGVKLHILSAPLWWVEILRKFREGIGTYRQLLNHNLSAPPHSYAVLCGIHENSFSSAFKNTPAQDFMHWFRNRFPVPYYWVVPASTQEYRSVDNCSLVRMPFPSLPFAHIPQFKKAARQEILSSVLTLLRGRWQKSYMLADRLKELYVAALPAAHLARLYVFTNASYITRPLWTYEAERKGAEIALFFYSTNSFNMNLTKGSLYGIAPGYSLMTWPVIYTQHENHKQFLRTFVSQDTKIEVPGLIPYEDNGAPFALAGQVKIAYLDVQPFRMSFMASIGRPCHVYTEDLSREAFDDIRLAAERIGGHLSIKPKRNVGKKLSPAYRKMLKNAEDHVQLVDAHISPERLCQAADIIICQPFTTAALFAVQAGKPVAYYDARGLFVKNQLACQGVPLLSGQAELQNWLMEVAGVFKTAV